MADKNKTMTVRGRRRSRRDASGPYRKYGKGHPATFSERLRRVAAVSPLDKLAFIVVLLAAAVFTGINMFHYPNYEQDEGVYMGSAWSMFEHARLSYYTYTYDHPFLGWFQLGLWADLVGGFLRFGDSINTGRALMLIVTVISTGLVFQIVRKATGRTTAALFAAVVFAVSPLAVHLHRQVYLDNLTTLWLLVSLYALIISGGRLWRVVLSAIAFGLAFWSKEISVVFIPGMLYLVFAQTHVVHRRFAAALWTGITASAISLFVILALLKDEFFPPGFFLSSNKPHVSMLKTFEFQSSRGGGGSSILSPNSDFRSYFGQWISADPFFIIAGLVAAGLGLLFWRRNRFYFGVSILTFFFMLLLARGGVVLYFHVIPLLALLALSLGLLAGYLVNTAVRASHAARLRPGLVKYPAALALLGFTVILSIGAVSSNKTNFTSNATGSQVAATRWIAKNLPRSSIIFMDAYPWADLRNKQLVGNKPFDSAHYALQALLDPTVRGRILNHKPGNADYLLYSPSAGKDFSWINGRLNGRTLPLVNQARKNSDTIRVFRSKNWTMKLLRVRKVHKIAAPNDPLLTNTWNTYKKRFIKGGRMIDPKASQSRTTTSEGQAYAMLRAVYMNDPKTFSQIWDWTRSNLQIRNDKLLAWEYGNGSNGKPSVSDTSSATDADTDAALALLFAAKKFHDPAYEKQARAMLNDIWKKDTTTVGSNLTGYKRIAVAGDWARGGGATSNPVVNPSYLSPYAYKIFAKADPNHPWGKVTDSSYQILQNILKSPQLGGTNGLVPNWVSINPSTGDPQPSTLEGLPTNQFSYDASRVPWRISLDYLWFGDSRALQVLKNLNFPRQEIKKTGQLQASYNLNGSPAADYQSVSTYAGILPGLLVGKDPALAQEVFSKQLIKGYHNGPKGAYWGGDPNNYYDQNMAWFATAVMDGSMSNLWAGNRVIHWNKTNIKTSLAAVK